MFHKRERLRYMKKTALLFLVFLSACGACGYVHSENPSRNFKEQMGAAVKITTMCDDGGGYGTGVVVSEDRVLTAKHVVDCEDGSEPKVTVDPGDGVERDAYVEILLPYNDVARLRLLNSNLEDYMTPVQIGPRPVFGDKLCIGTAVPRFGYHCGITQPDDSKGVGHFVEWDWFTEFGNSGSAVYHDGKLIGLLDYLKYCQGGYHCVGGITLLEGYEWLIP
jgi:hypothetical protein